MKVSAQYAQEHFADILTAIDTGAEVELTRPGQSSLFLAPRPSEPTPAPPKRPRAELLYAWGRQDHAPHRIRVGARWTKSWKTRCSTAPIFPPEHA